MRRVIRIVQEQRDARYKLLRGFFRGADDGSIDELQQERLSSLTLTPTARAVGHTVGELLFPALEVRLVSLRRTSGQSVALSDDLKLMVGDVLVISGHADKLEQAELCLLKGPF
jgi:CPA2 family monovalent cation:H+ antiporter-2